MKHKPTSLSSLGAQVARTQDRGLEDRQVVQRARVAWENRLPKRRWQKQQRLVGHALTGAAAAAAVLIWIEHRPLRYEVEALEATRAGESHLLHAGNVEGRLRFSDGSMLKVAPDAKLRIDEVTPRGAALRLDRGHVRANVVHAADTEWSFRAGPFEVQVVGTEFDVTWEEQDRTLVVVMHEGSVTISGCSLTNMELLAGNQTTLHCDDDRSKVLVAQEVSAKDPPTQEEPAAPAASTRESASSAAPRVVASEEDAEAPRDVPVRDWRVAGARGRLREAYVAADAAGFEAECARASGRELLDLSDAALFAGRPDRAAAALHLARGRFGGTSASATAAFKLGRIASGRPGEAAMWFQTYLREAPGGTLAREALGRLIEIDRGAGNLGSARARSAQYLQLYPAGPHADLARSLVGP